MSGGHFDYLYHRLGELAQAVETDATNHAEDTVNDWKEKVPAIPEDIRQHMLRFSAELQRYSEMAKELEWYRSGDHGEDTIREYFEVFYAGLKSQD